MTDERELHLLARRRAQALVAPDKRQLRFNEIVKVAQDFYVEPRLGVEELVRACDRGDALYVPGRSMWAALREEYAWMQPCVAGAP